MKFNDDKPIFMQIVDMIENEILEGVLKNDDQTPSTNDFQKVFSINPATARKGLNILVDEGNLYKKRGMGMFVTDDAYNIILEKRQKEFFDNFIPSLVREMDRLNISKDKFLEELDKNRDEVKND